MNPVIAKSSRIRSTPFTSRIEKYGVQAYTVYNHMLLPASIKGVEEDYYHLKEHVQIWDVSAERQVQIQGKDAYRLTQLMTCRDLSYAKDHVCYYAPTIDDQGRILNDPLVMNVKPDTWWISIADTDVLLYAKGIAIGMGLEVNINEPNVNPLAVQGPKSFELMSRVFGKAILDLKFFHFKNFQFENHEFLIARSGWSKQGGFEIYIDDDLLGLKLFDTLMDQGEDLNVRPGCPNLIERIEGGLLSYGNDMDMHDTPLECGLDAFVSFNPKIEYLGKSVLERQFQSGVERSLIGIIFNLSQISVTKYLPLLYEGEKIGELRSACFSPNFQKCIGIAMVKKNYQILNTSLVISIDGQAVEAEMVPMPFIK